MRDILPESQKCIEIFHERMNRELCGAFCVRRQVCMHLYMYVCTYTPRYNIRILKCPSKNIM